MKTKYTMLRRGFTLVELLVVIVIIAALAGLTAPMVIRQRKKADQTEAVSNARQIGMALFEFETEYGSFPDASTATAVATATETTAVAGDKANDRFRQLIRAGITENEAMFFAKTGFTKKPDGIYNSDTTALAAGEVGYGMIVKTDKSGLSAAGNSGRPLIATPLRTAMDGTFDPDYFDSKAVVLKLDNSVTSYNITKTTGNVLINGKAILAVGDDTVWGTTVAPEWSYPVPKS